VSAKTKIIITSVACGLAAIWIANNIGPVNRIVRTGAQGFVIP
jgi:hypothetical protein